VNNVGLYKYNDNIYLHEYWISTVNKLPVIIDVTDCVVVGHGIADCGPETLAGLDGSNQTGTAATHTSTTRSDYTLSPPTTSSYSHSSYCHVFLNNMAL